MPTSDILINNKHKSKPMAAFPEFLNVFTYPGILLGPIMIWFILRFKLNRPKDKRVLYSTISLVIMIPWLAFSAYAGTIGFLLSTFVFIPQAVIIFIPMIIGIVVLKKSQAFQAMIDAVPSHWIIAIQTYRILGVMFLILYAQRLMPAQFALPAGIGDIIVGFSAPFVAYFLYVGKSWGRSLAIWWNYFGLLDLAIAVSMGFFTSPQPYQALAQSLPNDLLFQFPLSTIPMFAVPLGVLLHIYSLRVLKKMNGKSEILPNKSR